MAAGLVDATWTLTPKHESDVAAGVALVLAAGGADMVVNGAPERDPLQPRQAAAEPG